VAVNFGQEQPFGQYLYPNQTWLIYVQSLAGGSFIGGQFRDSFGNNIGGSQFLSGGSETWLYSGSATFPGDYFLVLINADLQYAGTQIVTLTSQVCNGYMPQ
jgi:hypothetical protein